MESAFKIKLGRKFEARLVVCGKFDGHQPAVACASGTCGQVLLYYPHEQGSTSSGRPELRTLTFNKTLTALGCGALNASLTAREVIALPGWQSGNAMVFIFEKVSGTGQRSFMAEAANQNNVFKTPALVIAKPGTHIQRPSHPTRATRRNTHSRRPPKATCCVRTCGRAQAARPGATSGPP